MCSEHLLVPGTLDAYSEPPNRTRAVFAPLIGEELAPRARKWLQVTERDADCNSECFHTKTCTTFLPHLVYVLKTCVCSHEQTSTSGHVFLEVMVWGDPSHSPCLWDTASPGPKPFKHPVKWCHPFSLLASMPHLCSQVPVVWDLTFPVSSAIISLHAPRV